MEKPKVAFFEFTCCEGCQLTVLSLGDKLLDLFESVDVVNFREASSYRGQDYEIAFIEGSISTSKDIDRIREIRKKAKICVALGSCAHIAGVNAIKNFHNQLEVKKRVYGEKAWAFDSILAQPIDAVIKVDYVIPGCPIDKKEFLCVAASISNGVRPFIPEYSVCVECKMKGNVCVYHKPNPIVCMGPITRAGCGAACPSVGNACEGCRGLVSDPNLEAYEGVLEEHGISADDKMRFYRMYNGLVGGVK
ncbi:MAG TPA: NADH:ubiquinone oxidoreductase [Hadesarchaea archaeon]|nr:NADH:ubiquinone oxidoreductase [Hadesarchaea archaeon]